MPAATKTTKTDTAENFVGSVFKFSISTFANMGIYALVFLLTNFFVSNETLGKVALFNDYTAIFMNIAILGLDQALMRFYHEPPNKLSSGGLFRHCVYFSGSLLLFCAFMGSTLFLNPLYKGIGFGGVGTWVIPLMFLNAGFYLVARYFNVLFRMEMKVVAYTAQSILMQVFLKLFYMVGAFFENPETAMILCSALGLGLFAIALIIIRRKMLKPQKSEFTPAAYKTILPFGAATAPTSVFVALNGGLPKSIITSLTVGPAGAAAAATGIYTYAFQLSSIVAMVQGGFAAFWTPYVYANYKTHQERILKVHDFINFIILVFFCLLVAFEDIIFLILSNYSGSKVLFPLLMLSAVFNILCETTVQGNALSRRPILDTIGMGIGVATNVLLCFLLIPRFALIGAAVAIVAGNGAAYLFRTVCAQRLYRTIRKPAKTALALAVAGLVAAFGTLFTAQFLLKLLASFVGIGIYCLMYRQELKRCWGIGISILKGILKRKKT
ncbi:lipopolysaccharide biosynthesis protein [Ruminococcaceae bacterium OttesenSCG-928-A16]|nr:lipopolysaccharide biosynthesis protein [Ruminococcaceae bacterium OttesenSCG-928-A16]